MELRCYRFHFNVYVFAPTSHPDPAARYWILHHVDETPLVLSIQMPACDLFKDNMLSTNVTSRDQLLQDKMFVSSSDLVWGFKGGPSGVIEARDNNSLPHFHLWHKQTCETGNIRRRALTRSLPDEGRALFFFCCCFFLFFSIQAKHNERPQKQH